MAYDGAYRLTQETVTEPGSGTPVTTVYSYEDANNRLSKVVTGGSEAGTWSYTSNALNQLTAFTRQSGATGPVAVSYTYDANGNRETRVAQASSLPPETTTYAWDNENRLIEVDKAGAVHRYEHDYRTRRISREEPPMGGVAAVKTAVVFAGGLSVAGVRGQRGHADVEIRARAGSGARGRRDALHAAVGGRDAAFSSSLPASPSPVSKPGVLPPRPRLKPGPTPESPWPRSKTARRCDKGTPGHSGGPQTTLPPAS
jgi:hypothetical protein